MNETHGSWMTSTTAILLSVVAFHPGLIWLWGSLWWVGVPVGHTYASFRIPYRTGRNSLLHSSLSSESPLPDLFWVPSSITVVILWSFPHGSPCLAGSLLHLGLQPFELPNAHSGQKKLYILASPNCGSTEVLNPLFQQFSWLRETQGWVLVLFSRAMQ